MGGRGRMALLAVSLLVAVAVGGGVLITEGGRSASQARPTPRPATGGEQAPAPTQQRQRFHAARGPFGARLVRRTRLRRRPGGRVVTQLRTRTEYGSPRVLAVVRRRGPWLAVRSEAMTGDTPGWIPLRNAQLLHEPYTLEVDLSQRRVVVRREGKIVRRVDVAIGAPGTTTPTGDYAVTDALRLTDAGSPYGCCALALTGRQPNVAQGWSGGDRLAIHGTSDPASIGRAVSLGCLRAREADIRWMLERVALGAPVHVRA